MAKNQFHEQVAIAATSESSVVTTAKVNLQGPFPDLGEVRPKALNLAMEYWTPLEPGESKVLIFMKVVMNDAIPNFNEPGQVATKDCAYFIDQTEHGFQILRCASSRLVSMARMFLEGEIYKITFQGMRPNKTNNNKSNFWAIQPVELAA